MSTVIPVRTPEGISRDIIIKSMKTIWKKFRAVALQQTQEESVKESLVELREFQKGFLNGIPQRISEKKI